jgi:integrase
LIQLKNLKRNQYMTIKIKYVTRSNGRWVYRPRIAPADRDIIRTDRHGFLAPPIRLGRVGDPDDDIIDAWRIAKNALQNRTGLKKHTLRWIVDQYRKSTVFKRLAIGSQKRSAALVGILEHQIKIDGKPAAFGDLALRHITRPMVRRLADKRLENYRAKGREGTAIVNREISLLASSTKWAIEHIDNLGTTDNPFRIEKHPEPQNTRYITDDEYAIQVREAAAITDYLPIVHELAYLLACRGDEVLKIKLSDIDADPITGGITVARAKGSQTNIIGWSPRLLAAVTQARQRHAAHTVASIDAPLIINARGQKLSKSGLDSAMQRLKKRMAEKGLAHIFFSLHKLKSKGISDAENDRIGGHKSEAMRNRYHTKLEKYEPPR